MALSLAVLVTSLDVRCKFRSCSICDCCASLQQSSRAEAAAGRARTSICIGVGRPESGAWSWMDWLWWLDGQHQDDRLADLGMQVPRSSSRGSFMSKNRCCGGLADMYSTLLQNGCRLPSNSLELIRGETACCSSVAKHAWGGYDPGGHRNARTSSFRDRSWSV